ncbi:hypothetical protein OIO90_003136 [Microbotryomycetes sp. JL221]|nr:hypothetical protein OIO90_003136 [Microbotryomycetes sp. JL221]
MSASGSGPSSTAERRRIEMADKRAKLAALRKAREDREQSLASSRVGSPLPGQQTLTTQRAATPSSLTNETSRPASRTDEIEALLRNVGVDATRDSLLNQSTTVTTVDQTDRQQPIATTITPHLPSSSSTTSSSTTTDAVPPTSAHDHLEKITQSAEIDAPHASTTVTTGSQTEGPVPLPPKPKELYDKAIQTTNSAIDLTDADNVQDLPTTTTSWSGDPRSLAGGVDSESSEQLRTRLWQEFEQERKQLDFEIQQEKLKAQQMLTRERARVLPQDQLTSVLTSTPFLDFISQSTKVIQRALADSYDYLKDYSIVADDVTASDDKAKIKLLGTWAANANWGKGRSVTAIDWSPKFPELFVAAYNKNPMAFNEPQGIACVWNLHSPLEPEYVFHAQSDLLSITFSPFHPSLIIGGTYSGQILIWDTKSRDPNPVLKTPLSSTGHTHPVYSLTMVGTQNAHNLISASTDGTVCAWTLDMVARPQETLELVHPAHNKTDEVSITCLGFPPNEPGQFWLGTEEGHVYAANRHDRAGSKAGLVQHQVWKGHSGPVTSLDFHPVEGPIDLSNLFLTSGVDWTIKCWARVMSASTGSSSTATSAISNVATVKSSSTVVSNGHTAAATTPMTTMKDSKGATVYVSEPILSFEGSDDYVYDVKWHPHHPALFASVDGAGKLNLWNINVDTEVPVMSTNVGPTPKGLNKLAWDRRDGRRVAIGSSDGSVYVYELNAELVTPKEDDWEQVRRVCHAAMSGDSTLR